MTSFPLYAVQNGKTVIKWGRLKNFNLRSRESKSSWVWLRTRIHRRRALWNRAWPCILQHMPSNGLATFPFGESTWIRWFHTWHSGGHPICLNPPALAGVAAEGVRKLGCRWSGEQLHVVDAPGVQNCFSQDHSRRRIRTRWQVEYMSGIATKGGKRSSQQTQLGWFLVYYCWNVVRPGQVWINVHAEVLVNINLLNLIAVDVNWNLRHTSPNA